MADQHQPTPVEECNRNMVSNFYKALGSRDAATVHSLLAPDIEWWFHGPPSCNRLMRWLTGSTTNTFDDHSFAFNPISVVSIGSIVVAEGCSPMDCKVSWVHAWTVTDGVITQVREYFNTSVTVTRFAKSANVRTGLQGVDKCQCVWQSKLTDNASMPGLLLAV
ncbi:wound-induced protein, Wun1, NTF2-like domain protein [Artemisia annua]|uniref:Wound-induced protein, Wun1, NTF2-like domain protein n=1 Tax=Artemisia annua TaxID=35608 RepID=A0A2U1QKK9_ARTAN|nr:wound-induced protein, Wun1, NTF2-like domain protein [Artemisia annua]